MNANFYVERGENKPHLPITELTGLMLLAHQQAVTLHQDGAAVVLRLTKAFAKQVSA